MALYKEVTMPDGVTVSYHRINNIRTMVNVEVVIEVESYLSANGRKTQKDFVEIQNSGGSPEFVAPYSIPSYFFYEYEDGMTVADYYEKLKQEDMFNGAIDVIEDGQQSA